MMLDELNLHAIVEAPGRDDYRMVARAGPVIRAHPAHNDLQVPAAIWRIMFACYGLFFGGLLFATGRDREAIFLIVICIGYAVLYFGLSGILIGLDGHGQHRKKMRADADLDTWTGPMSPRAVFWQILTIPFCLAFFGIAIAVIRAWVG